MRDFMLGGALTATYMLIVIALNAIHPALPFVAFALTVVVLFVRHIRTLVEMVKNGELQVVRFF